MNICLCRATVFITHYLYFILCLKCYLWFVSDGFLVVRHARHILWWCVQIICFMCSLPLWFRVALDYGGDLYVFLLAFGVFSYELYIVSCCVALCRACRANHKWVVEEGLFILIMYPLLMEKAYQSMLSHYVALCRAGY